MAGAKIPWLFRSQGRLALAVGLGLLLPMLGAAGAIVMQTRRALRAQGEERLRAATHLAAQVVEEHFAGLSSYVESYARRPLLIDAIARGDWPAASVLLEDLVTGNPALTRAFVTDPAGIERVDYPHDPAVIGQSFAHRDWYKGVTRERGPYLSGVYRRTAAPAVHTVAIAVPLRGAQDEILGYLVAQDTVDTLSARLSGVRPSASGGLVLIDRYGVVVSDAGHLTPDPAALERDPHVAAARRGERLTVDATNPLTGERGLLSFAALELGGWLVMTHEPMAAVMAPAVRLQWAVLALTGACFLITFCLGFLATDTLRRQHHALAQLEATKSQLTGMLIHDLRNPLTAIMGSLDLVRGDLPPDLQQTREDLRNASSSCQRMLAMINVLVDVTRMEDGKMPIARAPHELTALLRAKAGEYAAAAAERRLGLRVDVPSTAVVAAVDRELLVRVIENLITNAIKHTPPGGEIVLELEDDMKQEGVTVRVRDTGEGIPEHLLPRLFQKYGRLEAQRMGKSYDTGLGLVFCRMAMELHGGKIDVRSAEGQGTTFSLRLPKDHAAARA